MDKSEIFIRLNEVMGKEQCANLALDILESATSLSFLFELTQNQKPQIEMRAAWVIATIAERFPEVLFPFSKTICDILLQSKNNSVARCLLKVLSIINLPEERITQLLDFCTDVMLDRSKPVALPVYAMTIFYRISEIEPDLKYELCEIVCHLMEEGAPAIMSRGKKILKTLEKEIRSFQLISD